MEVRAVSRYAGVSSSKMRLLMEQLPGKSVEDAINLLRFMPSPHARLISKLVKSAASNAENNYAMDTETLFVKRAFADQARSQRRFRAAARGRIHRYKRRSSHLTVIVDERET